MDSSLVIGVVFFLVAMAVLAGVGIGLVIGLAIGSRGIQPPGPEAAPQQSGRPATPATWPAAERSLALEQSQFSPALDMAASPRQQLGEEQLRRPVTSWSVALAIGVIVVCCMCTFLTAAAVTLGR